MFSMCFKFVTACLAKVADVVFVIDSSGSVGEVNFLKIKEFMKQTVSVFDIGDDFTRVGVITFSTTARLEFLLNTYNTTKDLINAIDRIGYSHGGTNTGKLYPYLILLFTPCFTSV